MKFIIKELSHDEVRAIAELAKLNLTDEEVEHYAGQISHILQYFEKLEAVDTSHIEPTASVLPISNAFREDIAKPALSPERAVQNGTETYDNQFRVHAVLDE